MFEQRGHESFHSQQRLEDLLAYPREDLNIELKGWLDLKDEEHKACLAKAILALANHGGGFIVLGFEESAGGWRPSESRPSDLGGYGQDAINSIVKNYAEPPFHCEVHHVSHPQLGDLFPVVVVPGGHRVPIRARRDGPKHVQVDTYLIRGPGPESRAPRSGREWDSLISRCLRAARDDLLDSIRGVLFAGALPAASPEEDALDKLDAFATDARTRWGSLVRDQLTSENPSRYAHGVWTVCYSIQGDFRKPTPARLRDILSNLPVPNTGWPPWLIFTREDLKPYSYDGLIECWLVKNSYRDACHSDFWRASPQGLMYFLRGYLEDCQPHLFAPGTSLFLTSPIWGVAECLIHAEILAQALGAESASVLFRTTWDGLMNRRLRDYSPWQWPDDEDFDVPRAQQNMVTSQALIPADRIYETLPETVQALVTPIYEAFDFYNPPSELIATEVATLKGLMPRRR